MQHCLQKTFALLCCATLFLCLPPSAHEMSDSSNGLESSFNSGLGSIEDSQPTGSSSGSNLVKNSNGLTKQLIEPPPKRHLEQSSESTGDEDGGFCNLTRSQQSQFHSTYPGVWNISDEVLDELDSDIQAVVDCAAPNDTILISTTRNIQPLRSIIISKNLTISSQSEEPLLRNGSIRETEEKVKFSCSSGGDLFIIRSAVTLANLIFEDCKGTGNVMSVETRCYESSTQDTVHLRHLEFRELSLSDDRLLLESVQPSCTHLWMENVILRNNSCGASGCMSLSMNNTLRAIQVSGNQAMHSDVALESHTVFVVPINSTGVATNVSASRNRARVFSVANGKFTVKDSYFGGNIVNQDRSASVGGSVLVSINSNITIEDSTFRSNSGLNGGAIYAQYSRMDISNASFQGNTVDEAGSAIHLSNGFMRLEDINITDNSADLYGTVLIGDSSALLNKVLFMSNSAESYGGGLSFHNSNITVHRSRFENNSAGYSGAAIYASSNSTLDVQDTVLHNNSAESNGGGIYAWNCNVSLTMTNFTKNSGDNGGGCYFNEVNATLDHVYLDVNRASDGSGGGIYIENGRLDGESLACEENLAIERGGGIYASDLAAMNISESSFTSNSAVRSGGGIYVEDLKSMSFSEIRIENNTAGENGGGVNGKDLVNVLLSNTYVKNNVGRSGGGVYYNNVKATVQNLTVSNNTANKSHGGGLYLDTGALSGDLLKFKANQASGQGGGIYVEDLPNLSLSATYFENNVAQQSGGGIYGKDLENTSLSRVEFKNNSAIQIGGGIYGEDLDAIFLQNVSFENNVGRSGGGGYYNNVNATMQNLTFSKNKAIDGSGGGVYASIGRINGEVLTFQENEASKWGGGIYALDLEASHLSEVHFHGNIGNRGGAIGILNIALDLSRPCVFTNNTGILSGGSIFQRHSDSTISSCRFEDSRAKHGGSLWIGEGSRSSISNCTFYNGTASSNGGGILIYNNASVSVVDSSFSKCESSLDGGAISVDILSNLTVASCIFEENRAEYGAGIHVLGSLLNVTNSEFELGQSTVHGAGICAVNGSVNVQASTFQRNEASNGTGGALYLHSSNVTIRDTRLSSNQAKNCGGVCVMYGSFLNATNISMHSNKALESGGGMRIANGSSLLCTRCEFMNNIASWGGGMDILADDSVRVVAQLQDSSFVDNMAFAYGGGLHFRRPLNTSINCTASNRTCGRVALLNTTFAGNTANISGSAILTTDLEGVLVSCESMELQYDFIDQDVLSSLDLVHPKTICSPRIGDRHEVESQGSTVGTYGRLLSFSTNHAAETKITGDLDSGFALESVQSGEILPMIHITVWDAFSNIHAPTDPPSFSVDISSPEKLFQGVVRVTITDGKGNFSDIAAMKKPGQYNLRISAHVATIKEATLLVKVRNCVIDEEPVKDVVLCQACGNYSYNFNPTEPVGCLPCPNKATCQGSFIIPENGYWHKGPCQANVARCIVEEACTYNNRGEELRGFGRKFTTCELNNEDLIEYEQKLCSKGYEGPLCGSCAKGYGLLSGYLCSKCPSSAESIITLLLLAIYLFVLCAVAIRGALPYQLKRKSDVIDRFSRTASTWNSTRSLTRDIQMVELEKEGDASSEDVPPVQNTYNPTLNPRQGNAPEMTRWKTAEVLKILINFLQVTTAVGGVAIHWTSGAQDMFEASEYIGVLTTVTISRPVDCVVSSDSALVRSVWRTIISFLVPGIVILVFATCWGLVTMIRTKSRWYFVKRAILSTMIVVYFSYLSLTKLAIRVFLCVDVVDTADHFSISKSSYWAVDTAIQCYGREHIAFIVIGVIVMMIVTLAFPLFSAIVVYRYTNQRGEPTSFIHETMGFLFRAFKEEYRYWESLVMLRKACMSMIVVFSYQLGGQLQALLASLLLMLSLYVHTACRPYREEFKTLNRYEAASLFVSCITLTLGQFLDSNKCSNSVKGAIAGVIIFLNIAMSFVLVIACIGNGIDHLRAVLEDEGIHISDDTRWWSVIKLFLVAKLSGCCGSSGSFTS